MTRMARWMLLSCLWLSACGGGGGGTDPTPPANNNSPEPTSAQPTVYDTLLSQLREQGASKQLALQLFSVQFTTLPSVTLAAGERGGADSGSYAVALLGAYWDQLTDAQRDAAARVLGWDREEASRATALAQPKAVAATDYQTIMDEVATEVSAKFAVPPVRMIVELDHETFDGLTPAQTSHWYWHKPLLGGAGQWRTFGDRTCQVAVFLWNIDKIWGVNFDAQTLRSILAHEATHCVVALALGDFARNSQLAAGSPWLSEGMPTWVMEQLHPSAGRIPHNLRHWRDYVLTPGTPLFNRSYDAAPFFGQLGYVLGDQENLWPRLLPAVLAGSNEAAFATLTATQQSAFLNHWGAGWFRTPNRAQWDFHGPGPFPDANVRAAPFTGTLADGQDLDLDSGAKWTTRQHTVEAHADIVVAWLPWGHARISDDASLDQALDQDQELTLCLRQGGCACPAGSAGAGRRFVTATSPLAFGLSNSSVDTLVRLQGYSLDSFCRDPQRPRKITRPPSAAGGGGSSPTGTGCAAGACGGSNGDPHLETFDGLRYDLQTVGELVLVRSLDDAFTVQVRQQPYRDTRWASINTAAALRIDTQRATITMGRNGLELRVDGTLVPPEQAALTGATVRRTRSYLGDGYSFTLADDTQIAVTPVGGFGIALHVALAPARKGRVEGLLGNANGDPDDDLVVRNGQSPIDPTAWAVLRDAYAPSWQVTTNDSLFDYTPGQSPMSFVDPTFPDLPVINTQLAAHDEAEKVCQQAGVSDARVLQDCILDVALTGEAVYADALRLDQELRQARTQQQRPGGATFRGEVLSASDAPIHLFDGLAGELVYFGGPQCRDAGMAVNVVAPDGSEIVTQFGCSIGRIELPQSGTYEVTVNWLLNRTGAYVIPMTAVRPDRIQPIALGSTMTNTIDQRAAHDVYQLTVTAGTLIRTAAPECTDSGLALAITDEQDALIYAGNGCGVSDLALTRGGRYTLTVNFNDSGTGPYHLPLH